MRALVFTSLSLIACSSHMGEPASASQPSAVEAPAPSLTPPVQPPGPGALIEDERNTIQVFESARQATVFVTQTKVVRDWNRGLVEVPSGSGTGFIWDDQGHIVTNAHVVDGGSSFTVTLHDGTSHQASLRGTEPMKDIAVLKLADPPPGLTSVRLPARGQPVSVGQKAIAIGNPFGLDTSLTVGVISAVGRDVEGFGGVTIRDMVQTDASINPGNSGGPLLDSSGRLIGMNTMIYSRSGGSAGIGFAVPTPTVRRIVPQLIATGHAQRVGLGVSLIPHGRLQRVGGVGVGVLAVRPESPAAKAGLVGLTTVGNQIVLGDVIVAIDDRPIKDYDDLYTALDAHAPGDKVRVTAVRDGKPRDLDIEVYVLE
ncbi:MAG: S1C family serine protease [Myxococcota bacterium]